MPLPEVPTQTARGKSQLHSVKREGTEWINYCNNREKIPEHGVVFLKLMETATE